MMPLKHWQTIAAVGLFLVILALMGEWIVYVPGYAELRQTYPAYIAQSYRTLIGVILVFLLAHALLRKTGTGVPEALGLTKESWRPVAAVLLMVLPLYAVFVFAFDRAGLVPLQVLFLAVLSPFGEELAFRGFAFGFLRRIAGWGFWPAALAPAAVFAVGDIFQAYDISVLLIRLLLTAGGAVLFAWLFEKWGGLGVPFALHAMMNFAWQFYAVGDSAQAQNVSIIMQLVTVAMAVLVTIYRDRIPLPGLGAPSSPEAGVAPAGERR